MNKKIKFIDNFLKQKIFYNEYGFIKSGWLTNHGLKNPSKDYFIVHKKLKNKYSNEEIINYCISFFNKTPRERKYLVANKIIYLFSLLDIDKFIGNENVLKMIEETINIEIEEYIDFVKEQFKRNLNLDDDIKNEILLSFFTMFSSYSFYEDKKYKNENIYKILHKMGFNFQNFLIENFSKFGIYILKKNF
ncbi:MAG: hypothetical protein ACP5IV_07435 [Caldisericia bacterium]